MIRLLTANFGFNVSSIGYQLYDIDGLIGARVTTGITNPVTGRYYANVDTTGATGIYWDDLVNPSVQSSEDLTNSIVQVSGTVATLDALLTTLATAHGAGSWATATGFSTLNAAGVRTAVGLATANLDTQLAALSTLSTGLGTQLTSVTTTYLVPIKAAVYDSATLVESTLTLSNAATLTITTTGRVTA